jgi:hypothetical protein
LEICEGLSDLIFSGVFRSRSSTSSRNFEDGTEERVAKLSQISDFGVRVHSEHLGGFYGEILLYVGFVFIVVEFIMRGGFVTLTQVEVGLEELGFE